jgi:ribonuclease HI
MNLQIKFAKCKIYETVNNTHYRELNKNIKKTKNIVVYIDASQIRKKRVEIEIKMTVVFTHDFIKNSKTKNIFDKIIIMKAKLQAISDAIAICSKKALKNSEIWLYINSQLTSQRLNSKSNVNLMLFNDIHQNQIDLRQKQCQIHIHWILSCKNIIENEKADELTKIATKELSTVSNMKIIIINFIKKQICKEIKLQWLNTWNISIKKGNQY